MNGIGILTNETTNLTDLKNIISYYQKDDHFVFFATDDIPIQNDYDIENFAVINFYYLHFFAGTVVFLSVKDLERYQNLPCKKILITNKQDLLKSTAKSSCLEKAEIMFLDANKVLRRPKNAELQSILR